MKSIPKMLQMYRMAAHSLRLNEVGPPASVIDIVLMVAEYHPVVVLYARAVVTDLLLKRKKMMAIKSYKDIVCVGLREAKEVVDRMDAQINPRQGILEISKDKYKEYSYYVGEELTCGRVPKKYGTWISDLKSDEAQAAHHAVTGD